MTTTRRWLSVTLVAALAALSAACGSDTTRTDDATTTSGAVTTTSSADAAAPDTEVRAYFLRDELVGPVSRTATDEAVGAAAMTGLLSGPNAAEQDIGFSSAIPDGTRLLDLTISEGVATVDLSGEFASGGGSASMRGRVAQVVFTLTQFPTVDAVRFEVVGEAVTVLGGEGLMLDAPQTRDDWEDLSPAILVESPLPFAEVSSPLHITGTANVFEAQFRVTVLDADGAILFDEPVTATSGTGTRGTFDVTVTFDLDQGGPGSVVVFDHSEKDGSKIYEVVVPVGFQSPTG